MERIMVVDAEPVVRTVVTTILERAGYTVEAVAAVQPAVDILKANPPDLLLTNIYLPGITGREAMQLFKSLCPKVKILIVSGLPAEDAIQDWAGRDGFDIFPKPFTAADLLEKIRAMLTVAG